MKKLLWIAAGLAAMIGASVLLGYDLTIGGLVLGRKEIERQHQRGYRKNRLVVGGAVIGADVDARKLLEVVPRLIVLGGLVAPKQVVEEYEDNLKVFGGMSTRSSTEGEV
jgi:hypothetical protein